MERSLRHFRHYLNERPFQPPFWLKWGHFQTVAGSLIKRDYPWGWTNFEDCDVSLSEGASVRAVRIRQSQAAPTIIVVHGMGGSSSSTYMQGLSHKAHREGWNAVLLNLYDCNPERCPPKVFHAGASEEAGEIIETLIARWNLTEVFLVGVSMGGNIVLKLLGEWGESPFPQVRAAAVISPLLDLTTSWKRLEKPSNFIYQRHFVTRFKAHVHARKPHLESFVDFEALMRIKTIREFDELFTAPLAGFRDAFDYYNQASALPYVSHIRLPTFLLHAQDDPLLPCEPLLTSDVRSNPWLLIKLTRRGGHTGFLERANNGDPDRFWAENRVIDFFREMNQSTKQNT